MKKVKIYQKDIIEPIELDDNDESNLDDYSKQISAIFKSNNIVILKTKSDSLVIRPQSISSVLISNIEEVEKIEEKEEILEDIITEI